MSIQTFVFFDLETTGLPSKENPAKITELTCLGVLRRDIEQADVKNLPPVSKLSFLFNPQKKIIPLVVKLTGLSNGFLAYQPLFKDKIECINTFLEFPKPVCLVAHNGDRFDFKIIKSEYNSVNAELPKDLLCIDSLKAFKEILKASPRVETLNNSNMSSDSSNYEDESCWPELDVTPEDWKKIDDLIDSFSKLTSTPKSKSKDTKTPKTQSKETKVLKNNNKDTNTAKMTYNLANIYKTVLKKEPIGSHRAEADCMMLLECVIATKEQFLPWADKNYKLLSTIKT